MTLTIKITSDFICPWCLVAETRLNKAIERLDINAESERIWYPYELNSRGIRSVPTIEIGKEIIVGGQPIEVFLAALQNNLEPKV